MPDQEAPPSEHRFVVDTGIFQQLGGLLVGRDSTALIELVKNAYDADATKLVVRAHDVATPNGYLLLSDNGSGMTSGQFKAGYLRIASRSKASGDRRSPLYRRRYTGEKGVGRLASHKLAAKVDIDTTAVLDDNLEPALVKLRAANPKQNSTQLLRHLKNLNRGVVHAEIDWDAVERADTIDDVGPPAVVVTDQLVIGSQATSGTVIRLSRLRRPWDDTSLGEVALQLSNFQPPTSFIAPLRRSIVAASLLFDSPTVRDADPNDPGMHVEFEGDISAPADYWNSVPAQADWILEIDADSKSGEIRYAVAPTKPYQRENRFAKPMRFIRPHPNPSDGPFLQARMFLRSGQARGLPSTGEHGGVRVYLEGFRVPPYGNPGNDWLQLDRNYTVRGNLGLDPLVAGRGADLKELADLKNRAAGMHVQPNRNFFGAVFLTESGSENLHTLVNREGFVSNESFDRLVGIVKGGTDLLHRCRALANILLKQAEKADNENDDNDGEQEDGDAANDETNHEGARTQGDPTDEADDDEQFVDPIDLDSADAPEPASGVRLLRAIAALNNSLDSLELNHEELLAIRADLVEAADLLVQDVSLMRVLASVGAQLAAFHHETQHLLPSARAVETFLRPREGARFPAGAVDARRSMTELRRGLERQASYLADVVSTKSRERRIRQRLSDRFDVAAQSLMGSANRKNLSIENEIPETTKSPPMFPAELLAIFTNVLSNAIKAAEDTGRIRAEIEQDGDEVVFVLSNTGDRVEVATSEKWFTPFMSSGSDVDASLGQGTGLGLTITRELLNEYGGTIRFREPAPEFATAVELRFAD